MLLGFAINFTDGATQYAIVSAESREKAETGLCVMFKDVETLVYYDPETIVEEQYGFCAVLTHGGDK